MALLAVTTLILIVLHVYVWFVPPPQVRRVLGIDRYALLLALHMLSLFAAILLALLVINMEYQT